MDRWMDGWVVRLTDECKSSHFKRINQNKSPISPIVLNY